MNLKRYSEIMGPAKNELLIEKGISPIGIPRIQLNDRKSNIYQNTKLLDGQSLNGLTNTSRGGHNYNLNDTI